MHVSIVIKKLLLITIVTFALLILEQSTYAAENNGLKTQQQFRQDLDKWLMQAYEGDKDAQFKVGVLFTNDQFRKPDYQQAVYWYKKAARQGHVLAQYNLGHQYLTGVGVQKNEKQAMQWWLKAAEQGHALSQFNIGRAYYLGIGLDIDIQKSKHWFQLAANNNEPKSIEILNKLGWSKEPRLVSTQPNSNRPTDPVISTTKPIIERNITSSPIALYTNPEIRSVLITVQDSSHDIDVIKRGKKWSSIQIDNGFPVWVYGDFIKIVDNYAIVTNDSVNARSVPIVSKGTVVGKLDAGEKLLVINSQSNWHRVMAPSRFKAWVKTKTLDKLLK